jgi:hypothetical protein
VFGFSRKERRVGCKTVTSPSLKSGERIPTSGLYQISHDAHALPSQVTLLKGFAFPPCCECAIPVMFKLQRRMPHLDKLRGNIVVYVLPVLEDKAA